MKPTRFLLFFVLAAGVASAQQISVTSPDYCSDINGTTSIALSAPGFQELTVKCWKQGPVAGEDSSVGKVTLDDQGKGSIDFPADQYPHGPITVRIYGVNGAAKDTCYLQLYNKGGVSWNEGMPKDPPPAEGMKLVFADDFSGPLSISSTDPKATYYDHKPPGGTQDFSSPMRFTSFDSSNNPFSQVDSYLRIRADGKKKSTGLISSVKSDGSGITASAPCYFECRFIAPDAKGSWPAFWLLTDSLDQPNGDHLPTDELDIIEAYGGDGPGSPNCPNLYRTTPHAWNQPGNKGLEEQANKDVHNPIDMNKFGISNWPDTFHIYGCKITDTDTIYYLDNVEVSRHKTMPTSKKSPFFFLINLGTGGGWPVDFSRYNNIGDMYVDYVRVYAGTPAAPAPTP